MRGAVLLRAGDVAGARTALRAGLALAPGDANLLTMLGSAEERAGRPGAASRAQRSALALDPATHAAAAGLRGRRLLAGTATPASWWLTRLTAVTALLVLFGGSIALFIRLAHLVVPTQGVTVGSSVVVGLLGAAFTRAMGRRRPRQIVATSSAPRARATPSSASTFTDLHPRAGHPTTETAAEPAVRLRERRPELQASMVGAFGAVFAGLFLAVSIHDAFGWLIAVFVAPAVASVLLAVATRPRVLLLSTDGTGAGPHIRAAHTALGCLTFPLDAALLIRDEMTVAPLLADRLLRVRAVPRVRTRD
jgi:hypothetical protein